MAVVFAFLLLAIRDFNVDTFFFDIKMLLTDVALPDFYRC